VSPSYRHTGSITNGPTAPVVRLIAAGYPKKVLMSWTPVSACPSSGSKTRKTLFVASTTKLLPTHNAWSGGSRENWLLPFASRWSRWFSPLKLSAASLAATALDATVGASSGFFGNWPFLNAGCGRLNSPASPWCGRRGRSSGCASSPDPGGSGRILVVPDDAIDRVPLPSSCAPAGDGTGPTTTAPAVITATARVRVLFPMISPSKAPRQ
jgi:hypothetical protein